MAWQCVSPKVILKGFKCCISNTVDETDIICCGMTVKVERVTFFCKGR
jgi:hypothetical protein